MLSPSRIRRFLFGLSYQEVTCNRRGFRVDEENVRQRLEHIGQSFVQGYHVALDHEDLEALARRLNAIEAELRGFAFEGGAMGLALLDSLTPWRKDRLQTFLRAYGEAHTYMIHVGIGWMLARLRRRVNRPLVRLDPLLRWLAIDGYGFHEGYFHWPRYISSQEIPKYLTGYALRVFDQGLGRSLWFVEGTHVDRISATIIAFPTSRRADLWSGIGLASAYAGIVDHHALKALRTAAGPYRSHLAQGAAFAAKARQRAGNPSLHTDCACQVICGLSAEEAAKLTDRSLDNLLFDGPEPAYELWRRRIQAFFATRVGVTP